jgi:hypothetical protein
MTDDTTGALDGDVALVTGASSGIGRATAEALASAGADVALAARRTDRIEALAEEIEREHHGADALPITTDVTERSEVEAMIDETREVFDGLDVLVNNAGVMLLAPVERADLDELERMVDVNLTGLMTATRLALPGMLEQGSGDIVNVSSVAGLRATENSGGYAATKFGVNAFSESLRKETAGSGVRVTRIEPGAVATELATHITDEGVIEEMMERFGDIETLQPEDIADSVRWAVTRPAHVSVNEVVVRPSEQPS